MSTIADEMALVAKGVADQVSEQLQPGMRVMVIIGAPDGTFVVAGNFENPRAQKVLQRALDAAKGGKQQSLLWLPPGVRA